MFIALNILAFMAGCSSKDSITPNSQVVARVNGDEITISQLNSELKKLKTKPNQASDVTEKLLTGLIDRQLFIQEAFKLNLDRSAEVQEAIASATAQIYAQAYIAKKLAKAPLPSDEAIAQFVLEHPAYFEQRMIYNTEDIFFENTQDTLDMDWVESHVRDVNELRSVLHEKAIHFETVSSQFSTDTLSPDVLKKIQHVKIGDLIFAHDNNRVVVKSVKSVISSPASKARAFQIARYMLMEQRKQAIVSAEIARLKAFGRVEILVNTPNELLLAP